MVLCKRALWVALYVTLIGCFSTIWSFDIASAQAKQQTNQPSSSGSDPKAVGIGRRPESGALSKLPPSGMGSALPYDELEEEMLHLLNKYRASKGLGPVRPSIALSQAADLLSRRLAEAGGSSRLDVTGSEAVIRAWTFNFPNYLATRFDTAIFMTGGRDDFDTFERIMRSSQEDSILTNPNWKVVGIARGYSEKDGATRWVFDFADYPDRTMPLTNRSLRELSLPENMIGTWHAQYQISSKGSLHSNDIDNYDGTDFTITLTINEDRTWVSQGYKAYQTPVPQEAGVWKSVHDASRNEEIVTFYREDGNPAAIIRVHAAPKVMTLFALDGGEVMKNFFRGVPPDANPKDDPQIIFMRGPANFFTPAEPFPTTLRCASCPQVFVRR